MQHNRLAIMVSLAAWLCLFPVSISALELDQNAIHKLYIEGEFEKAISQITEFQIFNVSYSRSDSIFIAKYLAVIYSADNETKEKGKYWMMRLLSFDPEAKLYDMYVSDGIREIFSWVRNEYFVQRRGILPDSIGSKLVDSRSKDSSKLAQIEPVVEKGKVGDRENMTDSSKMVSAHHMIAEHPSSQSSSEKPKKSHKKIWIASGIGTTLVAGGVAVVFLLHEPDKTREFVLDNPQAP